MNKNDTGFFTGIDKLFNIYFFANVHVYFQTFKE